MVVCYNYYADDILLHRQIHTPSDYLLLQQDINTMQAWFYQNHLELNSSKCKYMVISKKRHPTLPNHHLSISSQPLERVSTFKYLGVWLSDDLRWSRHIEVVTKRASKQVGMIFRRFYSYSNPEILKQLYISFVRPHLEYAVQVWDPYHATHINALEKVQKFALFMCFKAWEGSYDSLLQRSNLPSLCQRRKFLKLSYLFQVTDGSFHFPNAPMAMYNRDLRLRNRSMAPLYQVPFARTDTFKFSYFPDAILRWNRLPENIRTCTSLSDFKRNVWTYL